MIMTRTDQQPSAPSTEADSDPRGFVVIVMEKKRGGYARLGHWEMDSPPVAVDYLSADIRLATAVVSRLTKHLHRGGEQGEGGA